MVTALDKHLEGCVIPYMDKQHFIVLPKAVELVTLKRTSK